MRTEPESRTRLADASRLAADIGPVLAWYEWYADPDRRPLEPDDIGDLVDAIESLEAYAEVEGPVGEATVVLLAGGLGYSTAEHLDALDTLDRLSCCDRPCQRRWRINPRPNSFVALIQSGKETSGSLERPTAPEPLQLLGVSGCLPARRRNS